MIEPLTLTPYPSSGEILDGKYRVEKLLGEGGMGAVARATHLLLHRTVAVKFMNPQFMTFPGAVERFLNEGRASGAIKSDHVCPVSDVGCLPSGTPYLVMECLYGLDLADLLARDGPSGLPVQRSVHFVLQILRGLQAAHAIGIIHRDMKPSNCFVITHDGEDDFVKILDFGISKVSQPGGASLTQTNSALGTPLYMSPEQARSPRDVDARSDLYSVGVILYELLSGHTPFFSESGEFTEILFQLFTADPPPIRSTRPDLPEALAAIVHKALAREVPERHASALELAEALAPFAAEPSLGLIERMRMFRPPTKESVVPMEGLPTSMAAFSQLQRGQGTDVMVSRPTTDVQAGPPVTEMLLGARAQTPAAFGSKTEMLPLPEQCSITPAAVPQRARPDEALGRTRLEPNVAVARTGANERAARTDLGATRDAVVEPPRRSPLVFALPVGGVAVIGVVVALLLMRPTVKPAPVQAAGPSQPVATLSASSSRAPEPAESVVSVAPVASPSATPSATASVARTAVSAGRPPPPPPRPVLDTPFHN